MICSPVGRQLVDQFSAVIPGMQNAESVGLKKDHIGMAKFGDRGDWDFQTLSSHLSSMVGNAPLQVADKWDRHKRHEGALICVLNDIRSNRTLYHIEMDREIGSGRIVDVSGKYFRTYQMHTISQLIIIICSGE